MSMTEIWERVTGPDGTEWEECGLCGFRAIQGSHDFNLHYWQAHQDPIKETP